MSVTLSRVNVKIRVSKICGQAHNLSCGVADFSEFVTLTDPPYGDNVGYASHEIILSLTDKTPGMEVELS